MDMSMRDYFAAKIAPAITMIASTQELRSKNFSDDATIATRIAVQSYQIADAMIVEGNK